MTNNSVLKAGRRTIRNVFAASALFFGAFLGGMVAADAVEDQSPPLSSAFAVAAAGSAVLSVVTFGSALNGMLSLANYEKRLRLYGKTSLRSPGDPLTPNSFLKQRP